MANPESKKVLESIETETREKLEPHMTLDQSSDHYKKIYCD